MGYLKIAESKYSKEIDVVNLTYYIFNIKKCRSLICGANKIIWKDPFINPDSVAAQFLAIQNSSSSVFQRRIYHIIYSLDNILDPVCSETMWHIGRNFMRMYPEYQSVFVVHDNTRNKHLHMILNNVPFVGGSLLTSKFKKFDLEWVAGQIIEELTYRL